MCSLFGTQHVSGTVTSQAIGFLLAVGANFRSATVATAPGEKLLIGRRPVRKCIRPYDTKLVFVQYITFVLRKIDKKQLPPAQHILTTICTKSFVGWGFAPDPTGGAYNAPPDPLAVFRGPASKRW